jgi:hypothetical protein
MNRIYYVLMAVLGMATFLVPDIVSAAGGKAEMLIVVADNRVVDWSVSKWWVDIYNTDPFMFGVYCTLFTAFLGVSFGLITDQIMKRTGIDLSKRTIVEH